MFKIILLLMASSLGADLDSDEDVSCTLEDGNIGECVPYHLCDINGTIDAVINLERNRHSPCASYLDLCCPVEAERPFPLMPDSKDIADTCGWSNSRGVHLYTTGERNGETKFGEFPWIIAVLRLNETEPTGASQPSYIGAGSLIARSIVLTVAHIVATTTASRLKIRAGEWDAQTIKEIYPHQDRDVASVEIHKDFKNGTLFFDIALLFLSKPVDLAPHIAVACLPPPKISWRLAPGASLLVGEKIDLEKEGRYQSILRKVELPVVEHEACQTALRQTRLGRHFKLHFSFMCAGGEKGPEICRGDGGSPLSCPFEGERDRYMQVGIAAWRIGCGAEGNPGTYADVAYLRDWIDEQVVAKGYTTDSYSQYVFNNTPR